MSDLFAGSSAVISGCGRYRYRLERDSYGLDKTAVIMVNPSTADADTDDATIRKLKGFGKRNAWGRIIVGNLFAYRATDIAELATADDPIGPENDAHLVAIVKSAALVIYAWGALSSKLPKRLQGRWRDVDAMVRSMQHRPYCLGTGQDGHPYHPLMLSYARAVVPWTPPTDALSSSGGAK